jgi:hypothetical protein
MFGRVKLKWGFKKEFEIVGRYGLDSTGLEWGTVSRTFEYGNEFLCDLLGLSACLDEELLD